MWLDVDLCDRNQNVLARLDRRQSGTRVELGLNAGRRAFVPLALDDPARELVSPLDTVLRIVLRGPGDFARPLFIGRVLIPEQKSDPDGRSLGIHATDPLFQLDRLLLWERGDWEDVWNPITFAEVDQSEIMWRLIYLTHVWYDEGSGIWKGVDVHSSEDHGVIDGSRPTSVSRDRTYPPGKEVGRALVEMSEVIDGPDFELEPVLHSDDIPVLCRFNTFYPRQGDDLSDQVVFVHGAEPHTAVSVAFSPGGEEIANSVLVVGAQEEVEGEGGAHRAYLAEHPASVAQYGRYTQRLVLDDVTELATLESHAKSEVAAKALPTPWFDFTAAPEQVGNAPVGGPGVPPRFGVDYWLGDTIRVDFHADPEAERLQLVGRLTDAVVTERDSGQLEVKSSCAPEVEASGITGSPRFLYIPEDEGEEE